jgi:hypothetical protein
MIPGDSWGDPPNRHSQERGEPVGGQELIRPFIMTGGRTRSTRKELYMDTMVEPLSDYRDPNLPTERLEVLDACSHPASIAEVSARVKLPIGVVTVLVSDLMDAGLLKAHDPVGIVLSDLTRIIERVRSL